VTERGKTVESVRRANLGALLQVVHRDGPQSRAALTERTALNRSTIADLVGSLAELGLVVEQAPDPSRRVGRPSPIVTLDPGVVAIAVHPEVDAIELAVVGLDRGIRSVVRLPQDAMPTPDATAHLVAEQLEIWRRDLLAEARIVGIGVAVPGLVRTDDGVVRDAPHLRWLDAPLRDIVAEATGLPVTVGNDATLGTLAEHLFGAARGIDDAVYLNGGASGIGGGIIVHGMPLVGAGGYAGEFGQNRPGIAAAADRRAVDGVLEDEVSRARLLDVVGLERADDRELASVLTSRAGESEVAAELARQRRILATALANAANVLNPSVIVLGGFLAVLADLDAPNLDLASFEAAIREQTMPACAETLRVLPAALAEHRLLIGAAEAVFTRLFADPAGVA
jgi:predicted NBD/HSP70 family sugar kinase